jgi:UPF0716 protein FxsA
MFRILFLLFIIIPIIEIAVLMQVGSLLGIWPTMGIVILTAWLGAKNVRQQGLSTMHSVQTKMANGEAPSDEIVAGLLLMVAGVLLVTPGFVTDAFGLLLLVPAFRTMLIQSVKQTLMAKQNIHFGFNQQSPNYSHDENVHSQTYENDNQSTIVHGKTLDGEFERKD